MQLTVPAKRLLMVELNSVGPQNRTQRERVNLIFLL